MQGNMGMPGQQAPQSGFDSTGVSRDSARILHFGWEKLDIQTSELNPISIQLDGFQLYNPVYRENVINSTFGNIGTAYQSFYAQPEYNELVHQGFRTFDLYRFDADDVRFYDSQSPFTTAKYVQGGQQETMFNLAHNQNIKPGINAGIAYKRINSTGLFTRQAAQHSAVNLHFCAITSSRYSALGAVTYNAGTVQENGGLTSLGDTLFREDIESNKTLLPVELQGAFRAHFSNGVRYKHGFDLVRPLRDTNGVEQSGQRVRILHDLRYSFNRNTYHDDNPNPDYYSNIALPGYLSTDWFHRSVSNEVALVKTGQTLDSTGFQWQAKAYIRSQLGVAWSDNPAPIDSSELRYQNQRIGINAQFFKRNGLLLHVMGELSAGNYAAGNYRIKGLVQYPLKDFILKGSVESFSSSPDIQWVRFSSNFGSWQNDFKATNVNRLKFRIDKGLEGTYFEVSNSVITNFIFLDTDGSPSQNNATFNLFQVKLAKQFRFKKWGIQPRIWYQRGGESVLRLPELQGMLNLFFEGKIRKLTLFRFGIDIMANSPFSPYAYQPYSGLFGLSNDARQAQLLQGDVYISAKIKRAMVFAKMEHANSGFFGNDYILTPGHPLADRALKLGLSWTFFD